MKRLKILKLLLTKQLHWTLESAEIPDTRLRVVKSRAVWNLRRCGAVKVPGRAGYSNITQSYTLFLSAAKISLYNLCVRPNQRPADWIHKWHYILICSSSAPHIHGATRRDFITLRKNTITVQSLLCHKQILSRGVEVLSWGLVPTDHIITFCVHGVIFCPWKIKKYCETTWETVLDFKLKDMTENLTIQM